jgi:hypothetical protein
LLSLVVIDDEQMALLAVFGSMAQRTGMPTTTGPIDGSEVWYWLV